MSHLGVMTLPFSLLLEARCQIQLVFQSQDSTSRQCVVLPTLSRLTSLEIERSEQPTIHVWVAPVDQAIAGIDREQGTGWFIGATTEHKMKVTIWETSLA